MDKSDRKAAIAAYKERKVESGIFAVRCAATGETWVGKASDLSTIRNRIWFALGNGSHPCRSLQSAWAAHGAESFAYEALEGFDPDDPAYVRDAQLRDALGRWRERLGATLL